jgi:lysophospholipase L1-like esterase
MADLASKIGPVSTDFTSVNTNVAVDGVTYNQGYSMTGQAPAVGLIPDIADMGEGVHYTLSGYDYAYGTTNPMPRSIRTVCDGDKFAMFHSTVSANGSYGFMLYIDGKPASLTPYAATNSPTSFSTVLFPSAKPRLLEIRTANGIAAIYTQKQYNLWKPVPRKGPRVLVIGDSYASNFGATNAMQSIYWDIGPLIGSEDVWVDHVGGSGFGVHSTGGDGQTSSTIPSRYLDRVTSSFGVAPQLGAWTLEAIKPDVLVIHGGGTNDKYKGRSNAQVIADMITVIDTARRKLPNAKIIVTEGFAPPMFFSTFNPDYIAIRQGVQAVRKDVYYVDVATTKPWIQGTGYSGALTNVGNSDLYIGTDGAHPVNAGHLYIRHRMAAKIRTILADTGALKGTLV